MFVVWIILRIQKRILTILEQVFADILYLKINFMRTLRTEIFLAREASIKLYLRPAGRFLKIALMGY